MKVNKKGFTLLELLVVVLIIGILATIALPQYRKAVEKARMTEAISAVEAIAKANERFYLVYGNYTREIRDLDLDFNAEDAKYGKFSAYKGRHFKLAATNSAGEQKKIAIAVRIGDKYAISIDGSGKRYCTFYTPNGSEYEKQLCRDWANGNVHTVNL